MNRVFHALSTNILELFFTLHIHQAN
jgi:hypothetical protein